MTKSLFCLLIAMLSIQWGASLAKMLFPTIGPGGLIGLRLFFSSLILFFAAQGWRHFAFYRASWKPLALFGISLGLMNLTFYYALELIPLGLAVALEFTGPLAVAVLSSRRLLDLVWVGLAGLGIVLCFPFQGLHSDVNPWGVFLALVAGFFWALYIVFGKRVSNKENTIVLISGAMFWAALVVVPWSIYDSAISTWSSTIWMQGLFIAFLSSALPYTLEMFALKRLSTNTFGILMSFEPVLASLMGFLILKENLTVLQQLAVVCVVLATWGVSVSQKKTNTPDAF